MGREGVGQRRARESRNFNKFTRCRVQEARRACVPPIPEFVARLVALPVTLNKRETFVSIMEEIIEERQRNDKQTNNASPKYRYESRYSALADLW